MTLSDQQQKLSAHLWAVVDFCMAHKGARCMQWANDRSLLFRYVADCYFTGKLGVSWQDNKLNAVVFYWPDFKERIEAKYENMNPQFEWGPCHKGDALFVADVIGDRKAVAMMYQSAIERFPNMLTLLIMTYRKDKLICLYGRALERFLFRKAKP
jgi:hypothetical protein